MLLHAISRWPGVVSTRLWPYAMRYANAVRNQMADKPDGSSPLSRFSGVEVNSNMKDFHVFGAPVYALQDGLASGSGGVHHWYPRSRLGMYIGPSPRHARTVGLVLNIQTGLVSPQFHVKYDDFFETVRSSAGNPQVPSLWQEKAGFREPLVSIPAPEARLKKKLPSKKNTAEEERFQEAINQYPNGNEEIPESEQINVTESENEDINNSEPIQGPTDMPQEQTTTMEPSEQPIQSQEDTGVGNGAAREPPTTRSGRKVKWSRKFQEGMESHTTSVVDDAYYDALHQEDYRIQEEMTNPFSFAASSDPDTMYYHQAMRQPDKKEFVKAMVKEFNDHCDRGHWVVVKRTDVPEGQRILDAVWAMKRKRDIKTRAIIKYKARLNVHGGQQQYGINYFETYAPVVNWFAVRLLLALSLLFGWQTRQIDFVLAYPQAPIECDMDMNLPRGIIVPGYSNKEYCLKLVKNIYGQKQAGRVWNQYLCEGLKNLGFKKSKWDECVWFRSDAVFIFYVDDAILLIKENKVADAIIQDFQDQRKTKNKFIIEDCGNLGDYLEINTEHLPNGKIKLSQPHLIESIIQDVKPTGKKDKRIPAPSTQLKQMREVPIPLQV